MNERKTSEAEIQRVVRFAQNYTATIEVFLIRETASWNEADFLYAIDRISTDLVSVPVETRGQVHTLFRTLMFQREEAQARQELETANAKRHIELSIKLDELKKPHWSVVPNFWMTLLILMLTLITAVVSILALHH